MVFLVALPTLQVFDQNANRSLPSSGEKDLQDFFKILLAAEFDLKDKYHISYFGKKKMRIICLI